MNFIKRFLSYTNGWPIRSYYGGVGTILALHRVLLPNRNLRLRNNGLEITPCKLEHIIEFFKKKDYDFLSIDELPERLKSKAKTKFLMLTFDDGYADNYELAYPILKSNGIPFSVYLTNNYLKQKIIIWWYALEHLLLESSEIRFSFRDVNFQFETQSLNQKEHAFNELRKLIIAQNTDGLAELTKVLFHRSVKTDYTSDSPKMLKIEDMKEMVKSGLVSFGAHTHNHLSLANLSREEFVYEVENSKNELEELIEIEIKHFSYPFGTKNEVGVREFEWIKELGFETAVTGRPGNIHNEHLNHLTALPRLYINEQTSDTELSHFISGQTPCLTGIRKRVMID